MENEISKKVIGAAIETHRILGGPGLLEHILDILVANKVILEIKATELDHAIYQTQLLTYLRLSGMKLGLILNFGKKQLKDGICRVVNEL